MQFVDHDESHLYLKIFNEANYKITKENLGNNILQ